VRLVRATVSSDRVAHIVLSRPEKRNAINGELAADLEQCVAAVAADGVRSAIMSADGPVFCAGADLTNPRASVRAIDEVVNTLISYPLHWTVIVRQPVLGAGLSLLAACPLVLATTQASFSLPEMSNGFFPTLLLPSQIATMGARTAYNLAFSAAPMNASKAVAVGVVSEICDDAEIDSDAAMRAAAIASRPGDALAEGIAHWQQFARTMLLR
jgi:enoyl-CoA hydratase/carnithine racemase